uniref:ARID domain-containing protein n=1 Tax=Timema genevievae TaxID=629358 RepID=A0A7R9K4U6_TIMGE|nr:unnamed protein product [Timema genevievae]
MEVVHKLGGYNRVTNHNQWKTVSHKLGFGMSGSSVINLVKQSYKKFLHSFEDFYRKLGCTMVNHPRGNRSRHRAGRSLIRDRDRATPINIPKDKDKSANTIAEKRTTELGDRDTQLAESIEFLEDTKKGTLEESTKLPKDLTKEEHTKKMENIEVVVDKMKEKEEKVKPKEEKLKLKEQKVKPKEEKIKPKEEKVKPKEEKVKPKEEKVKPKEDKMKPKEEKMKAKEEKLKPKEDKVKPKEEKVKPQEEKLKPKEEKVKPKEEKLKPKEEKVNPKEEKVKPKEEKVNPKEEKVNPKEEKVKLKEEKVKPKEEKVNPKEEKVNPKEEKVNPKEEKVNPKEIKVNPKENKVNPKEDKLKMKDDKVKPKEDKVKLKDDKPKVLEVPKKDIEDKEERLRARETKKDDKSKEKELRGRMTELEKVVRIVLEDGGRLVQMSAAGCSTHVPATIPNKEIKARKEEKTKFITKEKLEEKQKIKEGDKLTTDEGENPDEIKRKVEKKSDDDEKKDVAPVDRRTRESRSPGREFEKKPSPPSLQKTKKLDDDIIVLGCQKKRGRKRKDSEEKPRSEERLLDSLTGAWEALGASLQEEVGGKCKEEARATLMVLGCWRERGELPGWFLGAGEGGESYPDVSWVLEKEGRATLMFTWVLEKEGRATLMFFGLFSAVNPTTHTAWSALRFDDEKSRRGYFLQVVSAVDPTIHTPWPSRPL